MNLGNRADQFANQIVKRSRVGLDGGFELQMLPAGENRHPVIPQCAADQDHISGAGTITSDLYPFRNLTDRGGGDVDPITVPTFHHLGVPGNHRNPTGPGGFPHRGDDALELLQGKSLFEDETGGDVEWTGPRHGDIVEGAVYRQRTDIPAGEEEW